MSSAVRLAVLGILVAGCGDDGAAVQIDAGTTTDTAPTVDACTSPAPTTVYLNRNGGTYNMGPDDAVTNTSVTLDMQRVFPAWPHDDTNWNTVKACVTAGLSPFAITVTDVDPGTAAHHEIVFTTMYWGSPGSLWSISGFRCDDQPARSVTFVFASDIDANETALACDSALSQFASATTGLDHSRDCLDFLGVNFGECGPRTFLDKPVTCGEQIARECSCGGTTQNSYRTLADTFGLSCE